MRPGILLFLCGSLLAQTAWAQETPAADSQGITGEADSRAELESSPPESSPPESSPLESSPLESSPLESSPPRKPVPPAQGRVTAEQAKQRLETVVTLSITSGELRGVLSSLAKTYGLNIVADDKVKGSVSITLRGVTLGEALKQILELNGYTYLMEDSILKIVSLEEETMTEILPLNFIQPDVALEFMKKEASEAGILKVDEGQNGIFVTDSISKIQAMKKVLAKLDVPPQQVMIQARLLDVTHNDLDNLGLKLSSVSFDVPLRLASGIKQLMNITTGSLDISGPSADLTTDTVTATVSKGAETLTATIDALIRKKRVKVLASPSVTTLNNVESKITIGEKFPIKETTQTTTGTLQTTRFVDVGITMRVTPKISADGFIQMKIHPEVSSVSSTIDAGPRITTREADITLIIKNRESVVIAGLIKEEETMIRDRIPILGHIPGLGLLFSNRSKTYEQKELVIVITPYLVRVGGGGAPGSEAQEAQDRLGAAELYRQAEDFEFGKTLQASETPEPLRTLRAIELYENLSRDHPGNAFAPLGLWKAGELSWSRLRDPIRMEENWTRLLSDYPNHIVAQAAQRRIREIREYRARLKPGREIPPTGKGKAKARSKFDPPGFR